MNKSDTTKKKSQSSKANTSKSVKKTTTKKTTSTKASTKKKSTSKVVKTPEVIVQEVKEEVKTNSKKSHRIRIHLGFKTRVVFCTITFLILLGCTLFYARRTIEREELSPIIYSENGNISYKVYLKDNEYYTEEYLGMNRAYIANLVKYIDADFDYLFKISENTNMEFDYKVKAQLVIENTTGSRRYLEKEYTLLEGKNLELNDGKMLTFKENIKIDYNHYNSLANNFRSDFNIETVSYLNVYLDVEAKTKDGLNYKISDNNKTNLKIPLSEKAIEINLDRDNRGVTKQVVPVGRVVLNKMSLVVETLFFIMTSIMLSKLVKYYSLLFDTKSEYDKYVTKILKNYDSLIVESKTNIKLSKYNVIDVKSFTELLDVRDNLKLPIIYFNIVKHEKGIFYIKDHNDVYVVTIKECDLKTDK